MDFYFHAYRDLQSCATMNGIIPWTAARDYASTYGMDVEEFQDFWDKLRGMEEAVRVARKEIADKHTPKKTSGKAAG